MWGGVCVWGGVCEVNVGMWSGCWEVCAEVEITVGHRTFSEMWICSENVRCPTVISTSVYPPALP